MIYQDITKLNWYKMVNSQRKVCKKNKHSQTKIATARVLKLVLDSLIHDSTQLTANTINYI